MKTSVSSNPEPDSPLTCISLCNGGTRGAAIKYFTVKTNKSQHVILSVPAPLTAALFSAPSEARGCSHTDSNKWPHLHYLFRLEAKGRVKLILISQLSSNSGMPSSER